MAGSSSESSEPESEQFQFCELGSATRMREELGTVKALGGADPAEDVIGGLQKVAEMLKRDRDGGGAAGGSNSNKPQQAPAARNCVLFHVCDMPQHGREFNDFTGNCNDTYPDGPLSPTRQALPPPGRTRAWMEEAQEVLHMLKTELNVHK
ncbi:hypothetical protein GPECTOR_9g748 [Gonium pectorale]|uniref:Uncharacterized protein n=1 Tax=Gonium pectorale TaxID=33097 RepID=A0A150GSK8_GONPE|nr:hypothetical protein GPECTOR_9g748 [Gonium pectorale]|eukprot:KXZ52702.1 hypothetical protein GPECTOR_9g748 [Gonium pectorale]